MKKLWKTDNTAFQYCVIRVTPEGSRMANWEIECDVFQRCKRNLEANITLPNRSLKAYNENVVFLSWVQLIPFLWKLIGFIRFVFFAFISVWPVIKKSIQKIINQQSLWSRPHVSCHRRFLNFLNLYWMVCWRQKVERSMHESSGFTRKCNSGVVFHEEIFETRRPPGSESCRDVRQPALRAALSIDATGCPPWKLDFVDAPTKIPVQEASKRPQPARQWTLQPERNSR